MGITTFQVRQRTRTNMFRFLSILLLVSVYMLGFTCVADLVSLHHPAGAKLSVPGNRAIAGNRDSGNRDMAGNRDSGNRAMAGNRGFGNRAMASNRDSGNRAMASNRDSGNRARAGKKRIRLVRPLPGNRVMPANRGMASNVDQNKGEDFGHNLVTRGKRDDNFQNYQDWD